MGESSNSQDLDTLLSPIGNAVTSIAFYSVIVYTCGWIYLYSYYNTFEATWLVRLSSSRMVLSAGGVSLAILGGLVVVHLTDALRRPPKVSATLPSKVRMMLAATGLALVASGIFGIASDIGWGGVGRIALAAVALLYALGCLHYALRIRRAGGASKQFLAWITASLFFGVAAFPAFAGNALGQIDRSEDYSKLPKIILSTDEAIHYRALLISREDIFAVDLSNPERVIPLTWAEIEWVGHVP